MENFDEYWEKYKKLHYELKPVADWLEEVGYAIQTRELKLNSSQVYKLSIAMRHCAYLVTRGEKSIKKEEPEKSSWCCYELSKEDIEDVARRKEIDLKGIDYEGVIHYIKEGIEWALEYRDVIIEDAIHSERLNEEQVKRMNNKEE